MAPSFRRSASNPGWFNKISQGWGAVLGGAVALVVTGVSILIRGGTPRNRASTAVGLAQALSREGLQQEAVRAYREVIQQFGTSPGASGEVWKALRECEDLLWELERFEDSDSLFRAQITWAEDQDLPELIANLFYSRAEKAFLAGRYEDALQLSRTMRMRVGCGERADTAFDRAGAERHVLSSYHGEWEALAALGRDLEALSLAREASARVDQRTAPGLSFRLQEARSLESLGRHGDALTVCDDIVSTYREAVSKQDPSGYDGTFPMQSRAAEAMVLKADVLTGQGHHGEALEIFRRVAQEFEFAHAETWQEEDEAAREWAGTARQRIARETGGSAQLS